jgi:hypothetical protein
MVVPALMSTWIADGTQILKCRLYFKNYILVLQCIFGIANMIGAACNHRIPQANLHAGLNIHISWRHNKIRFYLLYYELNKIVYLS